MQGCSEESLEDSDLPYWIGLSWVESLVHATNRTINLTSLCLLPMQTKTMSLPGLPVLLFLLFLIATAAADNDAKRDDQRAPKSQSCNNPFQLVFSFHQLFFSYFRSISRCFLFFYSKFHHNFRWFSLLTGCQPACRWRWRTGLMVWKDVFIMASLPDLALFCLRNLKTVSELLQFSLIL